MLLSDKKYSLENLLCPLTNLSHSHCVPSPSPFALVLSLKELTNLCPPYKEGIIICSKFTSMFLCWRTELVSTTDGRDFLKGINKTAVCAGSAKLYSDRTSTLNATGALGSKFSFFPQSTHT